MGFGSFFRGIGAQLNPFDGGKTYGSYNPPQKKKQEQTNAPTVIKPTPKPNIRTNASSSLDVIKGAAKKPTDFGTLQVSNRVKIPNNETISSGKQKTTPDGYGLPSKVGDALGGLSTATLQLSPAVTRAATGAMSDISRLPSLALKGVNAASNKARGKTGHWGVTDTVDNATNTFNKYTFDPVNKSLDKASDFISKSNPIGDKEINKHTGNAIYRATQIGGNVIATATGVGTAANAAKASKIAKATKTTKLLEKIGRQLSPASKADTISKIASPVYKIADAAINTPIRGIKSIIDAVRGTDEAPAIVNTVRVPVTGGDTTGLKMPVRVVEGAPIQDVTPRLPGETPALAPTPKPTVRTPEPSPLIQDVGGGERFATPDALAKRNAEDAMKAKADRFNSTDTGNMNDVTPRKAPEPFKVAGDEIKAAQDKIIDDYAAMLKNLGEGNGVEINQATGTRITNNFRAPGTGSKRLTKDQWRDMAEQQLRIGRGEPSLQKAFDDAPNQIGDKQSLLAQGEQVDVPVGTPIKVKQVKGIDVQQVTDVPANLPETPGTVRVSSQTDPLGAQTQAVANAPVAAAPAPLPKVGSVLPNGRVVTKAMVEASKNRLKLARKLERQTTKTNEALDRVQAERGARVIIGDEPTTSHAATGEFNTGARGNVYETRNRELGLQNAEQATQNVSIKEFIDKNNNKNLWDDNTMLEAETILRRDSTSGANPDEIRILAKKVDEQASRAGGDLALLERTSRATDTSAKMSNKFMSKFYAKTESGALTDEHIAQVTKVNENYTAARDNADRLYELATDNPTKANVVAYEKAAREAATADKVARNTEFTIAKEAAKGDKSEAAGDFLRALEEKSDVPNFDYVNTNNLSGTGTIIRNNVNNILIATERMNLTGSNLRGVPRGIKEGWSNWLTDIKLRAKNGGKNPINWVKNWTTSGNTAGDIALHGAARGDAEKVYRAQLKAQGFTGEELNNRARLLTAKDPDELRDEFFSEQLQQAGLTSIAHGGKAQFKIEKSLADALSSHFGNIPVVRNLSKGIINTLFGYPTVSVRSGVLGVNRAMMGIPNLIRAGLTKGAGRDGSIQAAKVALRQAGKDFKSGAIYSGIGLALYNSDRLSFGYPTDKDAQERWNDERKTEYSIKIGNAWYPIPSLLGPFSIPLMAPGVALETLKNGGNTGDVMKALGQMVVDSSTPVDDLAAVAKALNGEKTGNWWAQKAASLAQSQIPLSGLLRQLAKIGDNTVHEVDKTASEIVQIYQGIVKGIPGLTNQAPQKLDSEGNVLTHPNALQVLAGASNKVNEAGVQRSQEINDKTNSQLEMIDKYGLLNDTNLDGILVDSGLAAYNKAKTGKQLDESDIKALKEGLVKGVSKDGTDTAYLEKGQYDTNLAVLNLKRELMADDPSTKPSDLKDLDTAIKRGTVYKDNQVPYELISEYKSVGVDEWRNMGNPEKDEYDPDMYQKLYEIDQMLTEAGVSYKEGALDKPKYFAKKSGSGSGSGSKKIGTDFGTLSLGGVNAPNVRQYDMSRMSGTSNIPIINIKRPEIVHKITQGSVQ